MLLIRWRWRWVLLATVGFAVIGGVFANTLEKKYHAEIVLLPREASPAGSIVSQLGQLGGLASLVGVGVSSKTRDESLAVLRSRAFARSFIERQRISEQLEAASKPLIRLGSARRWDTSAAVEFFEASVRTVFDDKKTGSVKIVIEWNDPSIAAVWANAMAQQLNDEIRANAIQEAERNVDYLKAEIEKAKYVSLTQSIGNLLEDEIRRLMIARGTVDYAYRIVDPAVPPRKPVWPKPVLLTLTSGALGFVLAIVFLVGFEVFRGFRPLPAVRA
jgi:uncharacterized protein involved in exopolysaccharide biosynthesis